MPLHPASCQLPERLQYNFIYTYASKLLHATPASLTTNQKNLEPEEMRVFLKYVYVRLVDIIETGEQVLAAADGSAR